MVFRRQFTYGLVALLAAIFAFVLLSDSAWAQADLTVTKNDNQPDNTVQVGENITYTITVTNSGDEPAQNVQLTDVLPANTTFVSENSNRCNFSSGTNTLTCNYDNINPGDSRTVDFVVKPTAAAGVAGQVSNTATAACTGSSQCAGGSATETTQVQPQISIVKNDRPNAVEVGEFIVYTVTVTNNTNQPQTVTILDALPDEVDFEDVAPDSPICNETAQNSNVVQCTITNLAGGASQTVQIVVQAEEEGTAQNTAQAFLGNNLVDQATVETEIDGDSPGPNPPPPPVPNDPDDDFFDDDDDDGIPNGFDDDFDDDFFTQEEQYEDAENDLNDEITDGEFTDGDNFDDDGDGGVRATAGDGVAEASTPGPVARAGDPDELAPETGVPDDVVDEIPTSGPLPNTGGTSLWVYAMVGAGGLLFLGALIRRMWRAE